jgi:hypothetical protein
MLIVQTDVISSAVKGNVAFVRRGTCALQTKFDNVLTVGAHIVCNSTGSRLKLWAIPPADASYAVGDGHLESAMRLSSCSAIPVPQVH